MSKDLLKKVRKIEIKARGLSQQLFSGHYHSAFKGRGMTFSEVREYQYGDDIRNIDWNVTARFNAPYVKIFEEERELTNVLVIDVSASNHFGTKTQFKSDMIVEIAAVLAFSAIHNNDKVGVIFFSDKVEKFIPPAKGRTHTLRIIRELIDYKAEGQSTNISEALRYLTNAIKKKATVFVLSDFMDHDFKKAMRIANNKHDVVGIHIYDHRERELPNIGLIRAQDAESGQVQLIDSAQFSVRKNYNQWWKEHLAFIQIVFAASGVDYTSIATDKDYVISLLNLFKMRESRF
jgi:uncharacterized protein (DUF58 family)